MRKTNGYLVGMFRIATVLIFLSSLFADEPTRLELRAEEVPAPVVHWFGIYVAKQKIGWLREEIAPAKDARIALTFKAFLQLETDGNVVRFQVTERLVFDGRSPYRLYSAALSEDMGQGVEKKSVVRTPKGFQASIHVGGETTRELVQLDFTLADRLASSVWLGRGGRKVGDKLTVRSLDMSELKVLPETFVLESIQNSLVRGVRQTIYVGSLSNPDEGELGKLRASESGDLISIAFGGSLEARREPEAIAKKLDAPIDMFAVMKVPVDKPLGDPSEISALVLEATGPGVKELRSGPRQSVVAGDNAETCVLKLGAAHGGATKATPEEIRKALEATREFPAKDKRILVLAKQVVGDATVPRAQAERLVTFVDQYIEDVYGPEYSNAVSVMRGKRGDCSAHAMLFVALARAVGIPAREVSGFIYLGDEDRGFGGHAWCEIVLDGDWVEVDPTWNEMAINPTHISFRGIDGSTKMLKATGNLSLRVVRIERR